MPPDAILAVDLGGTQMRAALVDTEGNVSSRHATPTPHDGSDISALIDLARSALTEPITDAVIAVPGRVDYEKGVLEYAPHVPKNWGRDLRADYLGECLGLSVALANDADAGAIGESYFGAARGFDDVCYVTVSTGVGAGVVLGRKLVRGRRSGTELGHTLIGPNVTSSDVSVAIEETASGSALDREAAALGMTDGAGLLDALERGDREAKEVWARLVRALGTAIVNLAHMFTPEMIVIGGGLGSGAGQLLLRPVSDLVQTHGPAELPRPIRFATAALGDDCVLAGCGAWHAAIT